MYKMIDTTHRFLMPDWVPDDYIASLGNFNVHELGFPFIGEGTEVPIKYNTYNWYHFALMYGKGVFIFEGKKFYIKKHAIVITNPLQAFGWEERHKIDKGYACFFNDEFIKNDLRITHLPPFRLRSTSFYELSKEEVTQIENIFLRIINEVNSDYDYKYDVAKLLIEDILHCTMKSKGYKDESLFQAKSAQRIVNNFLEKLEAQFPIENATQQVTLDTPNQFANALHIDVNHLNKSIKNITGKTTSQIITERILEEAKHLIRFTNWNIAEIAYVLNFKENTHFNQFFKKNTGLTPTQYRND